MTAAAVPSRLKLPPSFVNYRVELAYDEMFSSPGNPRDHYRTLQQTLQGLAPEELRRTQQAADLTFLHEGITFTVYGNSEGTERIFPNDLVPRIIPEHEWTKIEKGLTQRLTALNLFLKDIYHQGRILSDGIVPRELIYSCRHFRREMRELNVPRDAYVSVCGTDLVRLPDGEFAVLEDNLRVPSGVSYMLANRKVLKRVFPTLFRNYGVWPVDHYPQALLATLRSSGPANSSGQQDVDHRAADAGRFQLRLFRAHLSGAADGHRTGGRPRPAGARQCGLHAHHRRLAPRGSNLPPRGRRFSRSACASAPIPFSACPGYSTPTAPETSLWRMRSAPASPTTRPYTPTCQRSFATTCSRTPFCQTCPPIC